MAMEGTVLQALSQNIQAKSRLHVWSLVVVERLGHVGISTHSAGKSNTKEDLPRKILLPQKVQHNLTGLDKPWL